MYLLYCNYERWWLFLARHSPTNVNFESTKSILHLLCVRACVLCGVGCTRYGADDVTIIRMHSIRINDDRNVRIDAFSSVNCMLRIFVETEWSTRDQIQIWHEKHAAILAGLPFWWLGHLCWWMRAKCARLMAHLIFDRVNFNVNVNATSDKRAKYGELNVCKVPYCWLLSVCVM